MHKINLSNFLTYKTSVFVRQHSHNSTFNRSESWVLLSPVELEIKSKIETVGVPLKQWDITINYGVKTGYNEAFIITGTERQRLIDIDPKSEQIIRPILRGRDIKRYTHEFQDLWLIATFPILKIDIDTYPAVKQHLMRFGYDRLKQTGDVGARKKTNNKWFETQDSISYWEDFSKQKIIYPEITKFLNFYRDTDGFFTNNKCFIVTGQHISFLTAFFNSSLFKFCFKDNFPELLGGTRELRKIFMEEIPVIQITDKIDNQFKAVIDALQNLKRQFMDSKRLEIQIDNMIFDLYKLTAEEREIIGFIEIR